MEARSEGEGWNVVIMFFGGVNIGKYRDLEVYKRVETTLNMIYPALSNFPQAEKYVLCAQIKNVFINLMKNIMLASKVKFKRKHYQNEGVI